MAEVCAEKYWLTTCPGRVSRSTDPLNMTLIVLQGFPDFHFDSFYPQNLVQNPQKLGQGSIIKFKINFVYLWLWILIYFGLKAKNYQYLGNS